MSIVRDMTPDEMQPDEMQAASSCIFCKIAAREIPAEIVRESDRLVAFRDTTRRRPRTSC